MLGFEWGGKEGTYEGAQAFGEVFVVGQLIEGSGAVLVYEEGHGCWIVVGDVRFW
jgi:hypothetical protein